MAACALLVAVVFFFVGRSLIACFRQIDWKTVRLNPLFLALALACLCSHRLFTGLICNMLLNSFASGIGYRHSTAIIWSSATGRYVPGKMVAIASATVLLVKSGVRLPVALASLFLSTALTILIALVMAAPMLLMSAVRRQLPWAWLPSLAVVVLGLVCLYPRLFVRLCNMVLRAVKRPPLPPGPAIRPFLSAALFIALRCCFQGLAMWLTTRAFVPIGLAQYPLVLGSAMLAAVAGFLAVFVPAGLGVQEAVYLLTLGSVLGPHIGLIAVVFRFLQIITDTITGTAGLLMLKSHAAASGGPDPLVCSSATSVK
jgi:hypothetical protein